MSRLFPPFILKAFAIQAVLVFVMLLLASFVYGRVRDSIVEAAEKDGEACEARCVESYGDDWGHRLGWDCECIGPQGEVRAVSQ